MTSVSTDQAMIAELRGLYEKATPGPLHWLNPSDDTPVEEDAQEGALRTVQRYGEDKTTVVDGKSYTYYSLANEVLYAEFAEGFGSNHVLIATMWNHLPALLALAEQGLEMRDELYRIAVVDWPDVESARNAARVAMQNLGGDSLDMYSNLAIMNETAGTWGALPFLTSNTMERVMADFDLSNLPENVKIIPLTRGYSTIVDSDWYEMLAGVKCHVFYSGTSRNRRYAACGARFNSRNHIEGLHRIIMDAPKHLQVDHINGNGLDNRRSNLRLCTAQQNVMNSRPIQKTSRFKGVSWDKSTEKWLVQITLNAVHSTIGRYYDEEEAAKAYDKTASEYHGEFAWLNFPPQAALSCQTDGGLGI